MINVSYNFSENLRISLEKIEALRKRILLTIINPKTELRLRFEATVDRIYWSLKLTNNPLTKSEMFKLLTNQSLKTLTTEEKEVFLYKKAFDYIPHEWLVSQKAIKIKDIIELHKIIGNGKLKISENSIKKALDYLEKSPENPVVTAALAYIQMADIAPFSNYNEQFYSLIAYLFLYKSGYDFRGLLVFEKYWRKTLVDFKASLESGLKNSTVTLWLEYFAKSVEKQLEEVVENLSSLKSRGEIPLPFLTLNPRQKEIMSYLEIPNETITNKKVQSLFNISQITSSRDLSRLVSLGLLFAHGKGRSVYYTRV